MTQKPTHQKSYKKQRKKKGSPIKPILLLVGGALLIIFAAVLLTGTGQRAKKVPVEVSGAPNVKVNKEKVDLGEVKLGKWVEVSFDVANNGDQPLKFTEQPYVTVVEGC